MRLSCTLGKALSARSTAGPGVAPPGGVSIKPSRQMGNFCSFTACLQRGAGGAALANGPVSRGGRGHSFLTGLGRGKLQFSPLQLGTRAGSPLGGAQRTGPPPWSSAMCRSREGNELWFRAALAPGWMGSSTSVWKTLLWEENFFRRGLKSWEAPIPGGTVCQGEGFGGPLRGVGHSRLEEELCRLSLSLPGPKEEDNPLGLSRVWNEETLVRLEPLGWGRGAVPRLKERLLPMRARRTGL